LDDTAQRDDGGDIHGKKRARFVVLPTALTAKTFPDPPATWKSFTTRGFNIAKGKHADLTLVLKPD